MVEEKILIEGLENLLRLKAEMCEDVMSSYSLAELSYRQIKYLQEIEREGELKHSELAKKLSISKPSVTSIIKKFEKAGYIEKEKASDDARVSYVKITLRGKLAIDILNRGGKILAKELSIRLEEEDIIELGRILEKLG